MAKNTARKISYMPITKARINLGAVVRRVRLNKEYFILEKDGIPVAGIMNVVVMVDAYETVRRSVLPSTESAGEGAA